MREEREAIGFVARVLILCVRGYQHTLSHVVGGQCRFQPTCSHYSIEALARHGAVYGSWLTVRRICRCHPWGEGGFDPVPGTWESMQSPEHLPVSEETTTHDD